MPHILIIKPSSLGDIVHGLQVAWSLKSQRPELQISWVARDIFAPLVQQCAAVDHTCLFKRQQGLGGLLALRREIRQTRFDCVLDMQGLFRSGLMTSFAKAPVKIGRADSRECAGLFCNKTISLPAGGRHSHALDILLQFAPALGLKPELAPTPLPFRNNNNAPDATPRGAILMFPESRRPEKCWPGFAQLTRMITSAPDTPQVIWAGGNRIEFDDHNNHHSAPSRFLNLTGKSALEKLPQLIAHAACVVSNDSGPMHLAAALGVPTLGIFGPTDPRLFGPYPLTAPANHIIQAPEGDLRKLPPEKVLAKLRADCLPAA